MKQEKFIQIFNELSEIIGTKNATDFFYFVKENEKDGNVYISKFQKFSWKKKMQVADEVSPKFYKLKDEFIEIAAKFFKKNGIIIDVL